MKKVALALVLLGFAVPFEGQGKDKRKPAKGGGTAVTVSLIFDESDGRIIEQWIREGPSSGLSHGLAKRSDLPPALQKHLPKNTVLPLRFQKKVSPLPRSDGATGTTPH